jgi:DNA-binding MarR family transcriptional regulator
MPPRAAVGRSSEREQRRLGIVPDLKDSLQEPFTIYDLCVNSDKPAPSLGATAEAASTGAAADGRLEPLAPDRREVPSDGAGGSSAGPFRSVGFTLSTSGYAVARRFRQVLAPVGLEPREFALLRAVSLSEGSSQQAIGERLQIPASRMVAFVDALEARGLLERRRNPADRRARALHLTEEGRLLLGRAFVLAVEHERDLCAELSEAERKQLLDLLQRITARLGLAPGVHAALTEE